MLPFAAEEVLTTSHSEVLHLQVQESTVQLMNSEVQPDWFITDALQNTSAKHNSTV